MTQTLPKYQPSNGPSKFPMKLWLYTNYHCNLKCTYCVAESSPNTPSRKLNLKTVKSLVDEAIALGFKHLYFTGGEPFLLDEIFEMLAYSADKVPTTVLTNAMLFHGKRLQQLLEIQTENLILQVSLDGSAPEHHDPYRGEGTWQKTMDGIKTLLAHDFRVCISTTETPANSAHMGQICQFRENLGISEHDHIIRPLAKRGFSDQGMDICKNTLVPELTINVEGVFWHPLSTDPDMLVSHEIFPLEKSLGIARSTYEEILGTKDAQVQEFQ